MNEYNILYFSSWFRFGGKTAGKEDAVYKGGEMVALALLERVVRDSPSQKLPLEGGEGARSHAVIWRKSISDRGNNSCHGPEAEPAWHV